MLVAGQKEITTLFLLNVFTALKGTHLYIFIGTSLINGQSFQSMGHSPFIEYKSNIFNRI